jgi:hypothetical protein
MVSSDLPVTDRGLVEDRSCIGVVDPVHMVHMDHNLKPNGEMM